ncbi:MAG: polysaccharide biosynthesis protein [Hyphomicrobiales bacterium]
MSFAKASKGFRAWLIGLPRWLKRVLLIANDATMLLLALWAAYSIRYNTLYVPISDESVLIFLLAPMIGVAIFAARGLYNLVTRFIGHEASYGIYVSVALAVLTWALAILLLQIEGVPRSVVIVYGLFAAAFIRLSRQFAGWVLQAIPNATPARIDDRTRVVIFGAGTTGIRLFDALKHSRDYKPVAFVDTDKTLWGRVVQGMKVLKPEKLPNLISREQVREVFLALPAASRHERRNIVRMLEPYPVLVKMLPGLDEIASGRVEVSDLRPIDVEDLLGRDPVPPDPALLDKDIRDKSVMITGAGGSIGSELVRQILALEPRRIVLFDISEAALYETESEVRDGLRRLRRQAGKAGKLPPDTQVASVLGSVLDGKLVRDTIGRYAVQTIYHAAAYKHVPLVEANPITGLRNNTFGTLVTAEAALDGGVSKFVLVSTDKAVRPTSVMGASKRLAEMTLQGLAAETNGGTVFTIVRFGNVLDSSGSVVRRFRQQIRDGGPVTVTHPEIIRYFMSIPEAAQLVLQAGAMASGGDVFVLDMGQPVKIDDLARTMIKLSGLELKDDAHPDGDIEIEYVGLRQGEKLYEELLIGETTTGTQHPRIMMNSEPFVPLDKLEQEFAALDDAIDESDLEEIEAILKRTVEGYTVSPALPDEFTESEEWPTATRTLH